MRMTSYLVLTLLTLLSFHGESSFLHEEASPFNSTELETCVEGENWAILVAGSRGYPNYRHQADVCHAYQVLKKGGLKEENIVVFMYDDIAYSEANPTPGIIINQPNGQNVYEGVPKDYTGNDVNAGNFFGVLQGNKLALTGGSGKVVNSGPDDNIFIYFSDHGAAGLLAMPSGQNIYANDLVNALSEKHAANSFRSMLVYVEACLSGSMFEGLLPDNLSIYAVTASSSNENSYAAYCPPEAQYNTCLGDQFSGAWMEDSEKKDLQAETLGQQYELVRQGTRLSHVTQYGDLSLKNQFLSTYFGRNQNYSTTANVFISSRSTPKLVSQYDTEMLYYKHKFNKSYEGSEEKLESHKGLQKEISCRIYVDQSINTITKYLFKDKDSSTLLGVIRPQGKPIVDDWNCLKTIVETYEEHCGSLSPYGLKYVRAFANMCNLGIQVDQMIQASLKACHGKKQSPCRIL